MPEPDLKSWLHRLATLHPNEIELGLERVSAVAERMRLDSLARQKVVVAGTNGKGSTIATLEALLLGTQQSVGVYTSPHLIHYNERVRINGVNASDAALCAALEKVDAARDDTALTYFEFTTLAAFYLFTQQPLDVVLLEVGLGGRLDAVNIVDADIAIITRIDLDHQDWLGDDREKIAVEKAGILREDNIFVCADRDPPQVIRALGENRQAPSYMLGEQFDYTLRADNSWRWQSRATCFENLPLPALGLDNVATAIQAYLLLGHTIEEAVLKRCLSYCRLAGRQQQVEYQGISMLLDVAHNPSAVSALAVALLSASWQGKTHAVFGALQDKNWQAMLTPLLTLIDSWFLVELPDSPRAEAATAIAEALHAQSVHQVSVCKNPSEGLRRALSIAQTDDRIVVFGSFFTVGPILETVQKVHGVQAKNYG